MNIRDLRAELMTLSVYRPLLAQPVLAEMRRLLDCLVKGYGEDAIDAYTSLFYTLRSAGYTRLGDWLWDRLRYDDSPYAKLVEEGGSDKVLEHAAYREVYFLRLLAYTECDQFLSAMMSALPEEFIPVVANLPQWEVGCAHPFELEELKRYYREMGSGLYAQYRAFLWEEGQLIPVPDPDCPKPEDLLGYELQRDQVEANTRQMFAGRQANNVLLFGDGGTGKSATVKSMLYLPGMEDLRLIEIQKENITGLPSLIRSLAGKRQKFILFIDDLAFDQDDKTYSSMKTILEGSLEKRPPNVAIYATSNRRHLVRQTFSERAGEEVDTFETISEKTALAERFGLRIPYLTMNKVSYLALVEHLARQAGIDMPKDQLHAQAMTWEIRHAGRTPRVARQFIASLKL